MAKKFRANLYMESAVRLIDRQLQAVFLPNDYLWAGGRYPTKIQPEDLPDWYVHGYLYKRHGYISAKGIVDIVYVPNYFIVNHCHKYDTIYVSYHEKIVAKPKDGAFWYEGYDYAMDGFIGESLIEKVKIYSPDINTEEIMRELRMKEEWYRMRENECPLIITDRTPIRIASARLSKPWGLSLGFNDSSYCMIDLRKLAERLPKAAEYAGNFTVIDAVKIDRYGYNVTLPCGLCLTAKECYAYKDTVGT